MSGNRLNPIKSALLLTLRVPMDSQRNVIYNCNRQEGFRVRNYLFKFKFNKCRLYTVWHNDNLILRLTSKLDFRTQKGTSLEVDFKVEHITRCRNCY